MPPLDRPQQQVETYDLLKELSAGFSRHSAALHSSSLTFHFSLGRGTGLETQHRLSSRRALNIALVTLRSVGQEKPRWQHWGHQPRETPLHSNCLSRGT